jgi:hypothetical protein
MSGNGGSGSGGSGIVIVRYLQSGPPANNPPMKRPPPTPEPSFRRAVKPLPPATPEVKAERLLKMAENFLVNGARSMAKAKFQEVVDKYPDTEAAKTARRKLRGM